ncbi:Oidioi.mRNA.OKI2018_I69.XSR.g15633.t1.cds [Oikopleura dioica]|uniref:Oidioi.mRNA.OKI2018_I69.XSR.g15633.t1.cds n=1 Tax=Oikopleura dioica TaxID=34765 RepID=A0ABN7SDG0_OIKDI|nr:Oidioi.mRNA.OKI2018_I69.XSR.g15633.t1.cds [Oikopleura dioica]
MRFDPEMLIEKLEAAKEKIEKENQEAIDVYRRLAKLPQRCRVDLGMIIENVKKNQTKKADVGCCKCATRVLTQKKENLQILATKECPCSLRRSFSRKPNTLEHLRRCKYLWESSDSTGLSGLYCINRADIGSCKNLASPITFFVLLEIDTYFDLSPTLVVQHVAQIGAFHILLSAEWENYAIDFTKKNERNESIFKSLFSSVYNIDADQLKMLEECFEVLLARFEKSTPHMVSCILEEPDYNGETIFYHSSRVSERISKILLKKRTLKFNFVREFTTPSFKFGNLTKKMLRRGISPFVVDSNGIRQYEEFRDNFQGIKSDLLGANGVHSFYYSSVESKCTSFCSSSCKDGALAFELQAGAKIKETPSNLVFKNSASIVLRGTWHGEPAAFKHILKRIEILISNQSQLGTSKY